MSDELPAKARQVLDAARNLFIADGFGATNMDAIALAAGVSKATIYAHYANKGALFAAIVQHECSHISSQLAVEDYDPAAPLKDTLLAFARRYTRVISSKRVFRLARMVFADSRYFPEIGQIFYDSAPGLMRERLATHLRDAQTCGTMISADALAAADQLLAMLRGDLLFRLLIGEEIGHLDPTAHVAAAVTTFCARYARSE